MKLEQAKTLLSEDGIGLTDKQIMGMVSIIKDFCSIVVSTYVSERKSIKRFILKINLEQMSICLQTYF